MSQHYFLSDATTQPSARWREAFERGVVADLATVLKQARALVVLRGDVQSTDADTLWLTTLFPYWPQVLGRLNAGLPRCPVVVVSPTPSEGEGLLALQSGARGYCNLHAVPDLFQDVAQAVQRGGLWVGPDLMTRIMAATRNALAPAKAPMPSTLSAREVEVANTVAEGHSNKEVARILGITERTVKAHLGSVFEKLGVRDRLHLVLRLSDPSAANKSG